MKDRWIVTIVRICLCVVVLAAACTATAQAQIQTLRCPAPDGPVVSVNLKKPEPRLVTRQDMATLRGMAGIGEQQDALGLYTAELRTALNVRYKIQRRGDLACLWVSEAEITLEFEERTIHIARELALGSCRYNVTLEHERGHARVDDAMVAKYLPQIRRAVADTAGRAGVIGPIGIDGLDEAQRQIGSQIERVFRQKVDQFEAQRRNAQAARDTPEAYHEAAEHCRGR
jgi:hypothetical protein